MLSEQEIKRALHASRVVPLPTASPHGPFGLAQLAHTVARILGGDAKAKNVVHPLEMPAETWHKLEQLADEATKNEARPVSASEVASAILQQFVAGNS